MAPYIAEVTFTDAAAAIQATLTVLMPSVADDTAFSLFFCPFIKTSDGTTEMTLRLEDSAGNSNTANAQAFTPGTSYSSTALESSPLELPLGSVATGGSASGVRTIYVYGHRSSGSGTCYLATTDTDSSPNIEGAMMWIGEP